MRTTREPAPYPYDRLRRVSRQRLPWLRRAARAVGAADTASLREVAGRLLGADLTIEPSALEVSPEGGLEAALSDPLVAVVLARDDGSPGGRAAIEVDPHFAARCVDRALGGGAEGEGAPHVAPPTTPMGHAERGVLAFVAARLLAASNAPFVVLGVVTTPAALVGALGARPIAALPASLGLGEAAGFARAWLPEPLLDAAQLAPRRDLFRLGALPLEVCLDAAWGTITRDELEDLRVGDAVLLDDGWMKADGATFRGDVRGQIAGARRMVLRCALEDSALRVKLIDVSEEPAVREGRVMDPKSAQESAQEGAQENAQESAHQTADQTAEVAADRAGDAPIEVAVEIARFTLPLAEIAGLAPGEVLVTGNALGERVTLRANGRAVASGELVDVDGEVGVRILSLGAG
ncbi:MAG: type III secretion system cytoplasmic ring protein SctQ [Deltaproteobacteria bacterium]|nr:type III secretion system cytoplasmic ring protein SctQ [Deltaproteobacteria bacterium]